MTTRSPIASRAARGAAAAALTAAALAAPRGDVRAGEKLVTLAQAHSADADPVRTAAATEGMGLVLRASADSLGVTNGAVAALAAIADEGPQCVDAAAKQKCAGLVACVTESAAAQFETAARKTRLPLIHVGASAATRTLDAADPVFRVEPSPSDWALAVVEALRLRSAKASVGVPAETKRAWVVFDDSEWARTLAQAVVANDVAGVLAPEGTLRVTNVAQLTSAKADGCDRVVVLGSSQALESVGRVLDGAAWKVPVLALDLAFDPAAPRRDTLYVGLTPAWAETKNAGEAPPFPAIARGFVAAAALFEAGSAPGKRGVVGALRDLHRGEGGARADLFDATGCVDRWRRSLWSAGPDGEPARVKPEFLPDAGLGPLLGGKPASRYHAESGSTCVRVGFGGGQGTPPRTIDEDLATLGLRTADGGTAADDLVRAEILARTCGKLSRIWLRNYDGSARPALSFRISFVPEGADTTGASAVWEATIAGDGPDGKHGGESFPGKARCTALSTYLLRNSAPLQRAKLTPPLAATDLPYLEGTYAWNTSAEGNRRSDSIRALLDGVASAFAMKLSKEVGHLAGLGVDHSGDPRSVMVAKGGEGTSDEAACFPPAFSKILDKSLGRVPGPK